MKSRSTDDPDDPLSALLDAVLDGKPVDWGAQRLAGDESDERLFEQLRVVASIANAHPSDAAARDDAPHGHWGPLKILESLGHGSFGEVFRAWDTRLDREVALKLLPIDPPSDATAASLLREGRALARVHHPNVVTVYGADAIDGQVGIWMERIAGTTLEKRFQQERPCAPREVIRIGQALCDAVAAVHKASLLHRDIKAQNVMEARDGRIVLMDFGASHEVAAADGVMERAAGTPLYTAPEVLDGRPATAQSDLYGLGVLLFRLATCRFPVAAENLRALREAHSRRVINDRLDDRDIPSKGLRRALRRALAAEPAGRFANAAEFKAALDAAAAGPRLRRRAVLAASVLAIAAATSVLIWRNLPTTLAPLPFEARDVVLVAQFDNRTGERELDGTLEYALARELSNSQHVRVAPPERVADTLALMRRSLDAAIDVATAREIAIRDGGIRAVVGGRVQRLGPSYLLTAEIVAPDDGRTVASVNEETNDARDLPRAVRALSNNVRATLGERRLDIQQSVEQLAKATTPSLRALRLYSESYRLGIRDRWPAALDLAEQAVRLDPTFATGQIWLAWAMFRNYKPPAEYLPHARRAFELAPHTTDRERAWIEGSYYGFIGDRPRAAAAYESLLIMDPGHDWAINNIRNIYGPGRWREVAPHVIRRAEMRPNEVFLNVAAARATVRLTNDFAKARVFIARVRATSLPDYPWTHAWATYGRAVELLLTRDPSGALAEVNRILATIEEQPEATRPWVLIKAVRYFLTLGRSRDALATLEKFDHAANAYYFYRAVIALTLEDRATATGALRHVEYDNYVNHTAWLLVRIGQPDRAEALLRQRTPLSPFNRNVIDGTIAAGRGQTVTAVAALQWMIVQQSAGNHPRSVSDLAQVWLRAGDRDKAIEALARGMADFPREDIDQDGPYGHDWIPNALLLAQLYRESRRVLDALPIERDLELLFAKADPDFPLAVKLRQLRASGSAVIASPERTKN